MTYKKAERALYAVFDDGASFRYPAEFLRVESPSAEVQGHGSSGEKRLIPGRMNVGILSMDRVGSYGVRITFDDLHDTGIYSWEYLHFLGRHKISLMREYVRALRRAGLSRDPKFRRSRHKQPTAATQ